MKGHKGNATGYKNGKKRGQIYFPSPSGLARPWGGNKTKSFS
jgi:hypothetical protein